MTVAISDRERLWAFNYSSEGRSRSLFHSTDVRTPRHQYPDEPVLHAVSDGTRLVVSEPLGHLKGVWNEVPEATRVLVSHGRQVRSRSGHDSGHDRPRPYPTGPA
jgi:glutamine amidotransferase